MSDSKSSKPKLCLDWATHEAAKFACENWHYSKSLPIGKLVKVGCWENAKFIGVVLFSHGTAKDLGTKYGLTQFECVELTRVALSKHVTPVSRIISIALRFLKKQSPGVRLVVSFADGEKGHAGGIYQAGNWVYAGDVAAKKIIFYHGKEMPLRTYFETYKNDRSIKKKCVFKDRKPKFRYLMALDESRLVLESKSFVSLTQSAPEAVPLLRRLTMSEKAVQFRPRRSN